MIEAPDLDTRVVSPLWTVLPSGDRGSFGVGGFRRLRDGSGASL